MDGWLSGIHVHPVDPPVMKSLVTPNEKTGGEEQRSGAPKRVILSGARRRYEGWSDTLGGVRVQARPLMLKSMKQCLA